MICNRSKAAAITSVGEFPAPAPRATSIPSICFAPARTANTEFAKAQLGTVTVGTHLAGSNLLLPQAIAALKKDHPNLTVVVRENTPDTLQNVLLSGDIDLTVGRLTAAKSPLLAQEKLYLEPIRLFARKGHPVHIRNGQALKDLLDYPWVLPLAQTALRAELEESFAQEGLPLPANRIECTTILTLHHLLVAPDVIAALPLFIARGDDKLQVLSTDLYSIGRNVGIMTVSDRPLSPSATKLISYLRDEAVKLHASDHAM